MNSNKPYLIRALYEWITENDCTPYLLVNTQVSGCQIPEANIVDNRIIFNITMDVVHKLVLGNEGIEFTARFSGVSTHIYVPIAAVAAIYAKENGQGMAFPTEDTDGGGDQSSQSKPGKGKPNLKIVK